MQILLNTDPHIDGSQQMAQHLETVVQEALGRFGEHITRVQAHLSDANGQAVTCLGSHGAAVPASSTSTVPAAAAWRGSCFSSTVAMARLSLPAAP